MGRNCDSLVVGESKYLRGCAAGGHGRISIVGHLETKCFSNLPENCKPASLPGDFQGWFLFLLDSVE